MNKEEIKEWDNAILDLLNKGLIEVALDRNGQKGFRIKDHFPSLPNSSILVLLSSEDNENEYKNGY